MATLSDKRLADWLEQVAGGLDAGMQSSNAVAIAKPLPAGMSQSLEASFQNGDSWAVSLESAGVSFSFAESAILKASELSGRIPVAMRRIALARRELATVKRRMKLALAYPLFLVHFAALVFSISYLVNGDTRSFLVSAGMVIVPVWLIGAFFVAMAKVWPTSVRAVARCVPVFSGYRKNWEAGTLCEVLACGFAAGMDVRDAWEIAADAADSPKLYRLTDGVLAAVSDGRKASEGIAELSKLSPTGFEQLYRSGEQTGSLEENLEAAAARYFADAKNKLFIGSLLYPKILLVGIFVYVGYKIVGFVSDYYQQLMDINA